MRERFCARLREEIRWGLQTRSVVCRPASSDEQGSLLNHPAQSTQVDEQVGEGEIGGGPRQSIRPDSLEAEASDLAVATFDRILAAVVVVFPESRAVGIETGQALMTGAIGMGEGAAHMPHLA